MNRFDRRRQALAIALAALAGFVDALGFLSGDSYFVSFMSGNSTRLAVDLAQDWRTAMLPAMLIAGFVGGVALGTITAAKTGAWRKPAVLGLVTALLTTASGLEGAHLTLAALLALVLAMGALNNTLQSGETPVGLTYMTGALVRMGQWLASIVLGKGSNGSGVYGLLWLALSGGAIVGALVYARIGASALWFAAMAGGGLTIAGWRLAKNAMRVS